MTGTEICLLLITGAISALCYIQTRGIIKELELNKLKAKENLRKAEEYLSFYKFHETEYYRLRSKLEAKREEILKDYESELKAKNAQLKDANNHWREWWYKCYLFGQESSKLILNLSDKSNGLIDFAADHLFDTFDPDQFFHSRGRKNRCAANIRFKSDGTVSL
jgi:hypothetical protein